MKPAQLIPAAFVLFLAGGLAAAQTTADPKQDVKPVPAAAPLVRSKVKAELTLPVTGLTVDNAAKVKTALEGLKEELYTCSMCKTDFAKAGDCPKCKTALTASKEALLGMVTTDPAKSQIAIQTKAGTELRFSAIERSLTTNSIKLDEQKLTIPGSATLLVSGATTADQAKALQAALSEAKLFTSAHAEATTAGARIHVVANATPATLAHIREVVTKAGPSFKVTDVIWNEWTMAAAG